MKPLGSITTILRKYKQASEAGCVNVPCGECNACCRSPNMKVGLTHDEAMSLPSVERLNDGWALKKNSDGSCSLLIDGKCSIYARRPKACRMYDCRLRNVIGAAPANDPIMREAFLQWSPPRFETPEDRIASIALVMAFRDRTRKQDGAAVVNAVHCYKQYLDAARKACEAARAVNG